MFRRPCGPPHGSCSSSGRKQKSSSRARARGLVCLFLGRYHSPMPYRHGNPSLATRGALGFLLAASFFAVSLRSGAEDPWLPAETVEPAQLVKELPESPPSHLTLVYVGTK